MSFREYLNENLTIGGKEAKVYNMIQKTYKGKNYAEILKAMGDKVHDIMKDLEIERNTAKNVKEAMFHDNYLKAYKSMVKKGDL